MLREKTIGRQHSSSVGHFTEAFSAIVAPTILAGIAINGKGRADQFSLQEATPDANLRRLVALRLMPCPKLAVGMNSSIPTLRKTSPRQYRIHESVGDVFAIHHVLQFRP